MATDLATRGWQRAACPPVAAANSLLKHAVGAFAIGKSMHLCGTYPNYMLQDPASGTRRENWVGLWNENQTILLFNAADSVKFNAGDMMYSSSGGVPCNACSGWAYFLAGGTLAVGASVTVTVSPTMFCGTVPVTISTGVWHYIIITENDTTVTLYVDGVAVASKAVGADALKMNGIGSTAGTVYVKDFLFFNNGMPTMETPTVLAGFG